ncbi:succinic semialdehyde dehydrogenase [Demequina sp. SYSU T00039]|uniref:Succinic semialdehyde dehydrogenase n=1 Tax=Demequina lignilytica TaxID=3051663 RepID=A0AAW7M709_9MICO|nr:MULTISPECIES: succinic semialdehyde dehydrogenase [unclassified Demequina]MDN4478380.1 succinic semialdehyde dehydrogenase [Demequina sp. SYSU T00039-1]MDN4487113.1 succinic semialdehyde dehydrogenase [Demequina sp. SYSU T00039]MDN4489824.1 succinic semialdehyde dehydrogenase [Demequina sp. SYSU T00068]
MTTTSSLPAAALDPARASSLAALATGGGEPLASTCPWDGTLLGELPTATREDVLASVERARGARRAWDATPLRERAAIARRVAVLARDRRDSLMDLIQLETGKNRLSAFEEVGDVILNAAYYARTAPRALRSRRRRGLMPVLTSAIEHRLPVGVVGIITPWNYPLTLVVSDALPALLAGNAVVLKPDSLTPLTALAGLELLRDAGLPDGLMQVVPGAGRDIGPTLVDAVDQLQFTGSTATGRKLAARCGERLIGCSMELGGKNSMVVLEDADVARAAAGAVRACFSNSGQLCVSIERIHVADAVHDAFVEAFVARVTEMTIAGGLGWGPGMGSLASPARVAAVMAHVDDAVARGATVLAGGRARPDLGPAFVEPTVLTDVTAEMRVAQEETFGPVVSISRGASEAELIASANAGGYGLNAAVWSRRHGARVAPLLEAGTVNVNEGYAAVWGSTDAPMGGIKDSGLGRRHGIHGLHKHTESQAVATQRGLPVAPPPGWSDRRYAEVMTRALAALTKVRP